MATGGRVVHQRVVQTVAVPADLDVQRLGFGLVADEVLFGGLFVAVVALFFSPSTARALSLATAALYVARACVFVASGGRAW